MGKFMFSLTGIGDALNAWEQANKIFVDGMEYVPVTVIDVIVQAVFELERFLRDSVFGSFIVLFCFCTLWEFYLKIRSDRKRRVKEEKNVSQRN